MVELLADTWHHRDLPVLRRVVEIVDRLEPREFVDMTPRELAERMRDTSAASDFDEVAVTQAVRALARGEYLVCRPDQRMGGPALRIVNVTEKAYRATGAWPSSAAMAERLLAALEDLTEYSDDPVEKARARKALEALGGFSRDTLIAVIGASAGVAMQ